MAEEVKELKVGWRYRYEKDGRVVDIVEHDSDLAWLGSDGQSWGTYRMVELGPTPPAGYDLILDLEAAGPKNVETDLMWGPCDARWKTPDHDDGIFAPWCHYCRRIPTKLQVRDGGRYRTREGKVVTMRPIDGGSERYPWVGSDNATRTSDGRVFQEMQDPDDLVEELPIEQPEAVEEADEPIRIVIDSSRVLRGDEEIASVDKGSEIINVSDGNTSLSFSPEEWAAIIEAINKLRNQ